ncbi:DUF3617 domain-containing protein [Candidatus Nitrotoga sp. M5]|uniref:DUF3617 domain-containing protein n=1 Tax=Candidatus Nitrotoga sp. M5 TaxID=2890409 RepID=UPI001EF488D6|nr:DUF3617 domain-containing protein [Candidatus Nitrotoga sp. M5]CAH1388197.1 conserved exported hypothetical protein [Candidatus Nitrotoga sp. M5]
MRKILLSISLLFAIPTANSAEFNMRPGLWEMTTKSDLLALVPRIPADQMQNLTNFAKQYGLDMPKISNGAATSQVCITQEMSKQKIPTFLNQNQYGCDIKDVVQTGADYKINLICEGAILKGSGVTEGIFTSPESFTGRTEFKGVVQGNPVNERAYTDGRWMGADCGTVQPLRAHR